MRTFLLSVLFALQLSSLKAQLPSLNWANKLTGDVEARSGSIALDVTGNVYSTGFYASGSLDMDAGTGVFLLTQPINVTGFFIFKNDANGHFVWAKQLLASQCIGFNCNYIDNVAPIAVDGSGNSYLTGAFVGTIDFDPGNTVVNLSSQNGAYFILKLDPDGNLLWAKQLSAAGISMNAITVDKNGNICITGGYSNNTDDFDPGPGVYNLTVAGYSSAFILKLDNAGNFIWAKSIGGSNYTRGYAITTDDLGAVYTAGNFPFTADFDPGVGISTLTAVLSPGPSGGDQLDGYISKLDVNGNFVWAKRIGGDLEDGVTSLKVDRLGNVLAAGYFRHTADFTPAVIPMSVTSAGDMDVFITRLNASGDFVWSKHIGGVSRDEIVALGIDTLGGVYSTGNFTATADFDPDPTVAYTLTATNADIFVSKLDTSGTFKWAGNIGGTDSLNTRDYSAGIAVSPSGDIHVTGAFDGTADFDPDTTTFNLISQGSYFNSYFTFKWSQCTAPPLPVNSTPVTNLSICKGQAATLTATGIGSISWYSDQTGGSYLASGNTFISSPLDATTIFYIQDSTCRASLERIAVVVTVKLPTTSTISANECSFFTLNNQTYTTSGAYTQVVTNAAGCDSIITLNLVIHTPVSTMQDITICAGETFTVGSNNYSSSGTYTDVLAGGNGCDSSIITHLSVAPLIDAGINQNGFSLIANKLNAFYQWINCNDNNIPITGETNQIFTPFVNGSYAVIVSDGTCSDISDCIKINRSINDVNIYPNPSTGVFNIVIYNLSGKMDARIYNSIGALVLAKTSIGSVNTIDIANLAAATYIIEVMKDDEVIAVKKLIKR